MRHHPATLRGQFGRRAAVIALVVIWSLGFLSTYLWERRVREAIEQGAEDHLDSLEAELALLRPINLSARPLVLPAPERFVQVLTESGDIVAASAELVAEPIIDPEALGAASGGMLTTEVELPEVAADRMFVVARQIDINGETVVGVVGASLAPVGNAGRAALFLVMGGGIVVALMVATSAWFAVRYSMEPVARLALRADEIAHGSGAVRSLGVEPPTAEMQDLARSLDHLLARIANMIDNERAFLDDASHELRTPIAVARGELDLLRAELEQEPELAASVASAIEELDRLDRLAADLLLLARARSSDVERTMQCELAGIARRAAGSVARAAASCAARVTVHGAGRISGDSQALERAFVNIIANAVEHADSEVDVAIDDATAGITVAVRDDGPGFSEPLLADAFARFPKSRDRSGTGLGLAIAAEIVRAHGGTIVAANPAGGGAEVRMTFPAERSRVSPSRRP